MRQIIRNPIIGLTVLLIITILLPGCISNNATEFTTQISDDQYQGFTTYLNEIQGYSLKYPINTRIDKSPSGGIQQENFIIEEPGIVATNDVRLNLGNYFVIQVRELSNFPLKTPDGVWDYDLSHDNSGSSITNITKKPITFRGNPGLQVTSDMSFSIDNKQYNMEWMSVYFIQNGKVYKLVYAGESDSFEEDLPTALKMFNSFKSSGA